MTFAPLFGSPCDLAQRIPSMVSDFLALENKIGRRFREDSITDIIIASLLKIGGANATVLAPSETTTGGDFDILIVEMSTGDAVQYRIQAKRLSPHPVNWMWGAYRELDHPHGQGTQSSTLIRSSAREDIRTIPLYAFYNPEDACRASEGLIAGIELADGRAINQVVKTLVRAKAASKRPRLKRVGYLRDLFFPLSILLCPPQGDPRFASTSIAPPRVSRAAVEAAIESMSRPEWMVTEGVPRLRRIVHREIPAFPSPDDERAQHPSGDWRSLAAKPLPTLIERIISRGHDEEPIQIVRIKRPKIVLVSRDKDGK